MKIVIQRVKEASVEVEDEIIGKIKSGLLLYTCFEHTDTEKTIESAIDKITKLRIFEDENEKMNLSAIDLNKEILSISQFTLSWDGSKGFRPSFDGSMKPAQARLFYSLFNKKIKDLGLKVEEGRFGANMQIKSINDGPVTFHLSF